MRSVALLSGAALSAAVLTACDSGVTEPPFLPEDSPTPTTTAVPQAESGGMEAFRAFAALIDSALADSDGSFFADRGAEDEMTCSGDEEFGPCFTQPAGTVLTGIPSAVAHSDAFALFARDRYGAMLGDWFARAQPDDGDEYGDGGLTLYALAHRPASEGGDEAYQAIVTGIFAAGPALVRQTRVLEFQFLDGGWSLTRELFASVPETAADWLSGECSECYDHWERWEGTP